MVYLQANIESKSKSCRVEQKNEKVELALQPIEVARSAIIDAVDMICKNEIEQHIESRESENSPIYNIDIIPEVDNSSFFGSGDGSVHTLPNDELFALLKEDYRFHDTSYLNSLLDMRIQTEFNRIELPLSEEISKDCISDQNHNELETSHREMDNLMTVYSKLSDLEKDIFDARIEDSENVSEKSSAIDSRRKFDVQSNLKKSYYENFKAITSNSKPNLLALFKSLKGHSSQQIKNQKTKSNNCTNLSKLETAHTTRMDYKFKSFAGDQNNSRTKDESQSPARKIPRITGNSNKQTTLKNTNTKYLYSTSKFLPFKAISSVHITKKISVESKSFMKDIEENKNRKISSKTSK